MIVWYVSFRLLGDCASQDDPLGQRRVLPVCDHHVRLSSLGHCAQVHVHEGLALVGPVGDLQVGEKDGNH